MKKFILSAFFYLIANFCFGQTQLEMNMEANDNYKKADKELNRVYNAILKEYKADTEFTAKLKIAQKAWIKFRDAEMDAIFPAKDERAAYGSVYPMCWSMHLEELTKERTKTLKIWITGIEEGDVCSGSVKIKG